MVFYYIRRPQHVRENVTHNPHGRAAYHWMVPKIKFHALGSFLVGPVINAREDR